MNRMIADLTDFFRSARHLWGRCPHCGNPFRLSDAAISSSAEPPRDWLRRFERREATLSLREEALDGREHEMAAKEGELNEQERGLNLREKYLDRDARRRAREMVKSDPSMKELIRLERQDAVQRSRSTLLGKLFECMTPFLQRLRLDPRDMRPIMNPIDYVCFDGLTAERRIKQITFIEVKCGRSQTSAAQRNIREAIEEKRVAFQVWQFGDPRLPIAQQLSSRRTLPPADA